jgi:predicted nucleic acid-binding protein
VIFDTNVPIYISKDILKVENLISPEIKPGISVISYIEALGFSFTSSADQLYMQRICASCSIMHLSDLIILGTINLRKSHRIKLPDAIIYATALVHNLPLLTNNIIDFKSLGDKVELINPFTL